MAESTARGPGRPIDLVERDAELAAVNALLESRPPGALVLEGEPGIGKTAVWRAGVELARERGFRVLACSPASSETRLSFAALADLLANQLDDVRDVLPPPQRRALEVALLASQLWLAIPDVASRAFGVAVAVPFSCTGLGVTVGESVGAAESILNGPASMPALQLPATSHDWPVAIITADPCVELLRVKDRKSVV